jgi:nitrogen regulatory protein P-II 1
LKMIEAIINPGKLGEVEDALQEMGIEDFMESTIICHGHQKGLVAKIVGIIGTIAKTERTEDCRIFVLPFLEAC